MLPEITVLSGLLENIYDAAADPSQWQAFLRNVALAVRGESSALLLQDFRTLDGTVQLNWQFASGLCEAWRDHFCRIDAWALKGMKIKALEWTGTSEHLVPWDELAKTEFYNDFAKPFQIPHAMFARIDSSQSHAMHLSVYRTKANEPFSTDDVKLLDFLVPHLKRAHHIHLQLSGEEKRGRSLEVALSKINVGVAILLPSGACLFLNPTAEAIVKRADGLYLSHGRFSAATPEESDQLSKLINEASRTSSGRGYGAGGWLPITRRIGSPLLVTVSPIGRMPFDDISEAAAVVFITDPDQRVRPPQQLLQTVFKLSPAEARVALLLADGYSTKEISQMVGITANTLKTHLASIFRKTGTARQSQLVKLVAMLPSTTLEKS